MGCFGNPIVVFGYVLCNILYYIVESFSLIRWCRHGWPHIKTSCTVCVIVLSLYSWTNIVDIKAFAGITIGIRAWVEDIWKSKRSQSTQDENKRNFHWRWSWLLFSWWYDTKMFVSCRDWRLTSCNLVQGGDCWELSQIPN